MFFLFFIFLFTFKNPVLIVFHFYPKQIVFLHFIKYFLAIYSELVRACLKQKFFIICSFIDIYDL